MNVDFLIKVLQSSVSAISYWADVRNLDEGKAEICDAIEPETDEWVGVYPAVIQAAIDRVVNDTGFNVCDSVRQDIYLADLFGDTSYLDSTRLDCIIQSLLFGELKYG